jgi:cell division protein FtsA
MKKIKQFIGEFLGGRNFCGIDIGSQKIKACLSVVQDKETLDLLAVYETETRGFSDTSVNDIGQFSSAIGTALDALIKKSQVRFRDVYLAVGGDMVDTRVSRAVLPLTERGNKLITEHDVRAARRQAVLLGVRLDEEVLCDFVRFFKVDDVDVALDPVGLYGRKLEVEITMVVSNNTRLRNIGKAVKQAGFEVNNVYYSAEALSQAVLSREQRQGGVMLVDAGARTTHILIFKEGLLKYETRIQSGGDEITRKIAGKLDIPFVLAEDIKKSYARVSETPSAESLEEILIKKDQAFVPVKRAVLNEVVDTEIAALIGHLRSAIRASGHAGQLKSGIVMAGGGTLIPGILERVEKDMLMPVVMGRSIQGLNNAASFCVVTSVAEFAYKGSARYVFDVRKPGDWWSAARGKLEELCNEYF